MNNLRILLALALSFLPLAQASAGNGTITTKDAGGVTRTFSIVTDGTGNFVARQVICDSVAAANCAGVNASNQLAIAGPVTNAGTFTVQNNAAVIGQTASGSAVTGNPVRIGLSDGTNAQNWLAALALGDGVNGNNTGAVAPWVYNGTTWDRVRGDATNGIWVNVKAGGAGGGAVTLAQTTTTGTGWTSGTSLNATQTIMTGTGASAVMLQLQQTTTLTAGAVTIEGTFDGTNWSSVPIGQVLNPNTYAPLTNPYTVVASTNQPFLILVQGYVGLRVKLSTAIVGSGTVTPVSTPIYYDPTSGGILNPTSINVGGVAVGSSAPFPVSTSAYPTGAANAVSGVTAAMTGTTSTSLIAAPAGALHNYITHIACTNSHATVGTFVVIQDGSGGTTIYEGYAAAVGGGFSFTMPAPLRQPTAATALYVADVTTGANVICSASGFTQ